MVPTSTNLRNKVLQYCMTNNLSIVYLKKKFKHKTIEIYGCTNTGEVMGVDSDGSEVTVSYKELGIDNFFRVFTDLYNHYCEGQKNKL